MEVSAPQEIADEEMLVCCSCHRHTLPKSAIVVVRAKTKTSKDVCRCRKCHNLRARCDRVVVSRGALVEDWSSVTEEEKRQFYVDAEDKCGNELLLKMQETITHSTMKRSTVKFTGTGDFMDEIDLDIKYANKPDQLANIKKNTRTMLCPVRRVKLFEDMKYVSETQEEETRQEEKKRKLEMAPKAQPKAKTRIGKKPEEAPEIKLKAGEKKKLNKKAESIKTTRLSLMDMKHKAERLKEFIPAYILKHSADTMTDMTTTEEVIEKAIDAGAGDIGDLTAKADETIEKGNAALARIKVQVDEASSFHA